MEYSEIGKELEIYTNIDYIGKGFPTILPNGSKMIKLLEQMIEEEEEKRGYMTVKTPSVSRAEIYMIEDRWKIKKKEIFKIGNEENEDTIVLRPYARPFHCSIFKQKQYNYKEMPIKYSETSSVFRDESSDEIDGLNCIRQCTFSDASIFLLPEQLEEMLKESVELEQIFMDKLGLNVEFRISNWDTNNKEEYIGTIKEWDNAIKLMKKVLDDKKIPYLEANDAKIYGPSIGIYYNKKLLAKIEIDFEIIHRFDLKYIDKDGLEQFPVYIHRQDIGSYESMLSILIEKYKGNFPTWIAPIQCTIIIEYDEYLEYAEEMKNKLRQRGVRVEIDIAGESIENRIQKAKKICTPYIVVISRKEYNNNQVSVFRYGKEETKKYTMEEVMQKFERRKGYR